MTLYGGKTKSGLVSQRQYGFWEIKALIEKVFVEH
jgi:hypothetical protein